MACRKNTSCPPSGESVLIGVGRPKRVGVVRDSRLAEENRASGKPSVCGDEKTIHRLPCAQYSLTWSCQLDRALLFGSSLEVHSTVAELGGKKQFGTPTEVGAAFHSCAATRSANAHRVNSAGSLHGRWEHRWASEEGHATHIWLAMVKKDMATVGSKASTLESCVLCESKRGLPAIVGDTVVAR